MFFKKKLLLNKKQRGDLFEDLSNEPTSPSLNTIFCTGMGRSGTHLIAELFSLSLDVEAFHLDRIGRSEADSFFQFSKWHKLNVDITPFIDARCYLSYFASKNGRRFLESNPYLSLHVKELLDSFDCKILIVYRNPAKVVESHYNKGWYQDNTFDFDSSVSNIPGYNYRLDKANHFFGRFFPSDRDEYQKWKKLTRVGKISWMWNTVYSSIVRDISSNANVLFLKIEELDYETYLALCRFLDVRNISIKSFQKILIKRPGRGNYKSYPKWDEKEKIEFDEQTSEILELIDNHPQNVRFLKRR